MHDVRISAMRNPNPNFIVLINKISNIKLLKISWFEGWNLNVFTHIFVSSKLCESGGIGRHARFRI
tara:strand:- start:8162 stop:8359 length:198 start_codon:yes stop_codon:yes gene_type:complete